VWWLCTGNVSVKHRGVGLARRAGGIAVTRPPNTLLCTVKFQPIIAKKSVPFSFGLEPM